jgi:hypothetical protein
MDTLKYLDEFTQETTQINRATLNHLWAVRDVRHKINNPELNELANGMDYAIERLAKWLWSQGIRDEMVESARDLNMHAPG